MTFREIELWIEGQQEHREWTMDILAWVQVNLVNVHVAKKDRISIDTLRPRKRTLSTHSTPVRSLRSIRR